MAESDQPIELGITYADVATGWEGVAVAITTYLGGRREVTLASWLGPNGEWRMPQVFDPARLAPVLSKGHVFNRRATPE
jgi:hypothetical protein